MSGNFTASMFDTMGFGDEDEETQQQIGTGITLHFLFATESGNAEDCANYAQRQAKSLGYETQLHNVKDLNVTDLSSMKNMMWCVSTRSDEEEEGDKSKEGRAPANALGFWAQLAADTAPKLSDCNFTVLALGDKSYRDFCGFGKKLDARLEQLGGNRVLSRMDCDVQYGTHMKKWTAAALETFPQKV